MQLYGTQVLKLWLLFSGLLSWQLWAEPARPAERIEVQIERTVLDDYRRFVAGRDPLHIKDFSGLGSRREVAEMLLAQQAIALGGLKLQFRFLPSDESVRSPRLLQSGAQLMTFDTVWGSAMQRLGSDIWLSQPVLKRGDYVAAVLTSPNNQKVLAVRNWQDFAGLTAVSSVAFETDWRTLQQLPLREIRDEYAWSSMALLVSKGWVDFMLAPFKAQRPFGYKANQIELVAVEGIKVLLDDSRHFAVSRHHPLGQAVFSALEQGLNELAANGTLQRAYREVGFFNPELSGWTLIQPPVTAGQSPPGQ